MTLLARKERKTHLQPRIPHTRIYFKLFLEACTARSAVWTKIICLYRERKSEREQRGKNRDQKAWKWENFSVLLHLNSLRYNNHIFFIKNKIYFFNVTVRERECMYVLRWRKEDDRHISLESQSKRERVIKWIREWRKRAGQQSTEADIHTTYTYDSSAFIIVILRKRMYIQMFHLLSSTIYSYHIWAGN